MEVCYFEKFNDVFPSEESCIRFLFKARWPEGFECPFCGCTKSVVITTRSLPLYECLSCCKQTSLIAGTMMEKTRTPLRKWFLAMYLMLQEAGINAVQLSQIIKVTYKTAWLILHKIRLSMSKVDVAAPLEGDVAVNAEMFGNAVSSTIHRMPNEHLVLGASSTNAPTEGAAFKIKLVPLNQLKGKIIQRAAFRDFQKEHIAASVTNVNIHTNRYSCTRSQTVRSLVKEARRFINQIYKGIGRKYLQHYLDEFCVRFTFMHEQRQHEEDIKSYLTRLMRLSFAVPIFGLDLRLKAV